jgi:hypothetical protein
MPLWELPHKRAEISRGCCIMVLRRNSTANQSLQNLDQGGNSGRPVQKGTVGSSQAVSSGWYHAHAEGGGLVHVREFGQGRRGCSMWRWCRWLGGERRWRGRGLSSGFPSTRQTFLAQRQTAISHKDLAGDPACAAEARNITRSTI